MEIHLRRGASLELLGNTGECIESYFHYCPLKMDKVKN